MILSGWRLAQPEFSNSPEEILSGEGAFLCGGRWNSEGVAMVYLGSSLAQAAMELLVHATYPGVLGRYCQLQVRFADILVEHIDLAELPNNWTDSCMEPETQRIGDTWAEAGSSLILQVPSAAVTGETNFLLNPHHKDFAKLEIGEIIPFYFDMRVLKEKPQAK